MARRRRVGSDAFRGLLYRLEPQYREPPPPVPREIGQRLRRRLAVLYGKERAEVVGREVERLIRVHWAYRTAEIAQLEARFDPRERFTERDVVLITYGDLVVEEGKRPLEALADFVSTFFRGLISTLHILPFFPYSSDRGFSVISYEEVNPRLGSWEEMEELEAEFKLMFDGVFNHVSAKSYWFQQFLNGDPEYRGWFTSFTTRDAVPDHYLELLMRPRTTPVLSRFHTIDGPRWVWTTFSADQIDLNFKNPRVLLRVLEILLYYVRRGADLIRLDAVTYLWCELGTSCAHLRQTHEIVKLFRDVLDAAAPHVGIITETNAPHRDNVAYFGDGTDEAQMVYNFALPPLVLHTLLSGDATVLTRWARGVEPPSETTAFFNFLDSHDGIGVLGSRGILTDAEIAAMCRRAEEAGGFVSYHDAGGREEPYELNVTWFSVLNPEGCGDPMELQVARFVASRAIALALRGVPGIYLPGLFGSRNDLEAVYRQGSRRAINRPELDAERLAAALAQPGSAQARIVHEYLHLLEVRTQHPAFHPAAPQRVLDLGPEVFGVVRTARDRTSRVVALVNVTPRPVKLAIEAGAVDGWGEDVRDLVSGATFRPREGRLALSLRPYQVVWLC